MASTEKCTYQNNKVLGRTLQIVTVLSLAVLLIKTRYWLVELKGHEFPVLPALWENGLTYTHYALSLLICALFLKWFKRAHINASLQNPNKQLTDSTKVALWTLLPGVNLIAPFYNMLEIFSSIFRRNNHVELIAAWWLSTIVYVLSILASFIDLGTIYNGLATYCCIYSGALSHVTFFTIITMVTVRQIRRNRIHSHVANQVAAPLQTQEFKRLSEVMKNRSN